jgi:quinolinate synthase
MGGTITKMVQAPLPQEYVDLSPEETDARIAAAKEKLGSRLVILGHHYQRDEIIKHADFRGDSYKLAKDAAAHPEAEFIVFCGVHFMAESADILTPDNQIVILPNLAAGCSMADMANLFQVRKAWDSIARVLEAADSGEPAAVGALEVEVGGSARFTDSPQIALVPAGNPVVVPVTYINSAANLKG